MTDKFTDRLAALLDAAARAHEGGAIEEIHASFYDAENFPGDRSCSEYAAIAYNFLDGWVDASNHDWRYYENIEKDDWPNLARAISGALRRGEPIVDERVLKHFDLRNE